MTILKQNIARGVCFASVAILAMSTASYAKTTLSPQYKQSDAQLLTSYQHALTLQKLEMEKAFQKQQVQWINKRYKACGGTKDRLPRNNQQSACYIRFNKKRIAELNALIHQNQPSTLAQTQDVQQHPINTPKVSQEHLKDAEATVYNLEQLTDGFESPDIAEDAIQLKHRFERQLKSNVENCQALKSYVAKQISYADSDGDTKLQKRMRTCMALSELNKVRSVRFQNLTEQRPVELNESVIPSVLASLELFPEGVLCNDKQVAHVCFNQTKSKDVTAIIYPVMQIEDRYYTFVNVSSGRFFKNEELYTVKVNLSDNQSMVLSY